MACMWDRCRCKDCKERVGFDLCADRYKTSRKTPGRFNQQHNPDHEFELKQINIIHSTMRLVNGQLGDGSIENFPLEGIEFRPEDLNSVGDGDGDGEHTQNESEGTNRRVEITKIQSSSAAVLVWNQPTASLENDIVEYP